MQQLVSAGERILDAEFRIENSHRVFATQRAKFAVRFDGASFESRDELDLIDVQGNSILLDVLLPNRSVSIGKTWKLASSPLAQLLGLDVISQSDVVSRLVSVKDQIALVETSGIVSGAVGGVATGAGGTADGTSQLNVTLLALGAAALVGSSALLGWKRYSTLNG